jgi:hypothetical protein
LNNVLASRLEAESDISPELQRQILKSSLQLPADLTPTQLATVMQAYTDGIRGIFIMFVPLGALSLLLSLFVLDVGLPDDTPKDQDQDCEIAEAAGDIEESRTIEHVPKAASINENVASNGLERSKTGTNRTA